MTNKQDNPNFTDETFASIVVSSINKKKVNTYMSKLTEYSDANMERVESSLNKTENLRITLSESLDRKVAVQDDDLDSVVVNYFSEFTATQNIDTNKEEYKLENERFQEQKSQKLTSTHMEMSSLNGQETEVSEFELECIYLSELLNEVKGNNVDRKDVTCSAQGVESDSESDNIRKKEHPNRRLQVERSERVLQKHKSKDLQPRNREWRKRSPGEAGLSCSVPPIKRPSWSSDVALVTETGVIETKQENSVVGRNSKSAELWLEVLSNPERWKTEDYKINIGTFRKGGLEIDYHEMLNRYMSCNAVRKLNDECLTFWDTRFKEKLKDPNSWYFLKEFYISPAQVEVIHMRLTDELSCMQYLLKVCESQQWPQPLYKLVPRGTAKDYLYCCELKSVQFTGSKPASNHVLARELAAHTCLEWLGLRPRKSTQLY